MTTNNAFTKPMLARLRAHLAYRAMTQHDLARKLHRPTSTLSTWLRGVAPAPADLVNRIERALKLPAGALSDRDLSDLTNEKE